MLLETRTLHYAGSEGIDFLAVSYPFNDHGKSLLMGETEGLVKLLARRLAERGTRFIQLFDWGWDSHGAAQGEALNHGFMDKCRQVDQATYGFITDLKQCGMLDETLVLWVKTSDD